MNKDAVEIPDSYLETETPSGKLRDVLTGASCGENSDLDQLELFKLAVHEIAIEVLHQPTLRAWKTRDASASERLMEMAEELRSHAANLSCQSLARIADDVECWGRCFRGTAKSIVIGNGRGGEAGIRYAGRLALFLEMVLTRYGVKERDAASIAYKTTVEVFDGLKPEVFSSTKWDSRMNSVKTAKASLRTEERAAIEDWRRYFAPIEG